MASPLAGNIGRNARYYLEQARQQIEKGQIRDGLGIVIHYLEYRVGDGGHPEPGAGLDLEAFALAIRVYAALPSPKPPPGSTADPEGS